MPPFVVDVSPTLIISAAIASRDFALIHHDRDAAQARGLRDIIMNIETTTGLIGRYVTDWGGPNSILRHLRVALGAPNYPHDHMTLCGSIVAARMEGSDTTVEINVTGTNSQGRHANAVAVVTLPQGRGSDILEGSGDVGAARPSAIESSPPRASEATPTADPVPDPIRSLIGVASELVPAPVIVDQTVIRQFVEAIDDRNPVYTDAAFAASSVHGGLVAPPGMLQCWTLPARRGSDLFAGAPSFELGQRLIQAGMSSMVATNCEQHYSRYLRPGNELRLRSEVTRVVGPKTTSLGSGFFVTVRISILDADGGTLGWHEGTTLRYRPSPHAKSE